MKSTFNLSDLSGSQAVKVSPVSKLNSCGLEKLPTIKPFFKVVTGILYI